MNSHCNALNPTHTLWVCGQRVCGVGCGVYRAHSFGCLAWPENLAAASAHRCLPLARLVELTARRAAAANGGSDKTVRELLRLKANVEATDKEGYSAADHARAAGHLHLLPLISP